jgi:hypothetical protein
LSSVCEDKRGWSVRLRTILLDPFYEAVRSTCQSGVR